MLLDALLSLGAYMYMIYIYMIDYQFNILQLALKKKVLLEKSTRINKKITSLGKKVRIYKYTLNWPLS